MRYQEFDPAPLLSNCVDRYWSLQGTGDGQPEPVFPDGHSELVAHLGNPTARLSVESCRTQPGCLLVGQMTQAVHLVASGVVEVFGIRFHPHGLWALSRTPQSLWADQVLPAEAWTAATHGWRERLGNSRSLQERIAWTDEFLLGLVGRREPDDRLRFAVEELSRQARVESVASNLGWSRRHLERMFAEQVGLRPKLVSRLARFQGVLRRRRVHPDWGWVDLAAEAGYSDQAHLVDDFRQFAGGPPGRVVSLVSEFGAALVRDRACGPLKVHAAL